MIRLVATILVVFWPTLSLAKLYSVRSGEHADFSRIVIDFLDVPEWTFGRVEGGYELRVGDSAAAYDLDGVFDLIPRDRLRALTPRGDGRLFFAVDCPCIADAFEIRTGLVIDIKDAATAGLARFESPLPPLPAATGNDRAMEPAPAPRRTGAEPAASLAADLSRPDLNRRTELAWSTDLAIGFEGDGADTNGAEEPANVAEPPARPDRVDEARDALIAQIGRAAVQGLIAPDLAETEARLERARGGEAGMPPEPMPSPPIPPKAGETLADTIDGPHLRIETAVDRGTKAEPTRPAMTNEGAGCLASEQFDIANWGTEPAGGKPLGLVRGAIVGEFDAVDASGIAALAKQYIYLTFGAEARTVITAFDTGVEKAEILLAMAEIMDDGVARTRALPRDQMACDTSAAMWAVLSVPALTRGEKVARGAVLSAFAELPLHLRRHLGPTLARRFLEIDDLDTATAIRDAIARAPGQHGEGFEMMEAQIALERGDGESGAEQLDAIVRADGPLAPEAVVALIEAALAEGRPVAAEVVGNTAALAFEARGTEMGARLMQAYLRARAHGGDILVALDETRAAEAANAVSGETALQLRQEILTLAMAETSDAVFLEIALDGALDLNQDDRSVELRRAFAGRLIDLGLTEQARNVLSGNASAASPDDRRLLARSFLVDKRPDLAIGYLAGLTDPVSAALRAETHLQAGEFGRAAKVFADLGDAASRARALWRGGDWQQAATAGTGAERAAAALTLLPVLDDDGAGPLARNRELLQRSGDARRRLAELLDATAKP